MDNHLYDSVILTISFSFLADISRCQGGKISNHRFLITLCFVQFHYERLVIYGLSAAISVR